MVAIFWHMYFEQHVAFYFICIEATQREKFNRMYNWQNGKRMTLSHLFTVVSPISPHEYEKTIGFNILNVCQIQTFQKKRNAALFPPLPLTFFINQSDHQSVEMWWFSFLNRWCTLVHHFGPSQIERNILRD